jgi:hypothetical protein
MRSGRIWRERAKVVDPRCIAGDELGAALALEGRFAVIGAPGLNKNAGSVFDITLP